MLLLPGLVANRRPEVHPVSAGQYASQGADEHSQAALLEYVHVVIVGVPHGPARRVSLGLLGVGGVDQATVAVGPLGKGVELADPGDGAVVDVPVGGAGGRGGGVG